MRSRYTPAALAAVAALSLWASLGFYRSARAFAEANVDRHGIETQQARFRDVLPLLPPSGLVGYLSDVPFGEIRGSTAFYGAQYALAPRILAPISGKHRADWVLGNFAKPVDYDSIAQRYGLVVVGDLGRGLVVFRRAPR